MEMEGIGVPGADNSEVSVVESGDFANVEALGEGDDGGVGHAEGEVRVGFDELGHPQQVLRQDVDLLELTLGYGTQEGCPCR
jgi:hypothetical protein